VHWLLLVVLPSLLACGSPIVGAECKKGYVRCDGRCVKLDDDPQQCGACGHDCGRFACVAGKCSTTKPRPDAGLDAGPMSSEGGAGDGGVGSKLDSGRGDGGIGRGGSGTPFLPDGGVKFPDPKAMTSCGIGQSACGDACADLRSDPKHCGDCGTGCPSDQFCQMGMCVDICTAPLKLCHGGCVDEQIDENHCGGCDTVCVSGICNAGVCADAVPGSLVVIGHDYTAANPPRAMQQIAGNAVFLARGASVQVLEYRGSADPASVGGVGAAINVVVGVNGRGWLSTVADPDQVSAQLRDVSAFVIHAQAGASDDELTALGEKWGLALSQFLFRGGVVVLFETQSTKNSGTYKLLAPAGLFLADSREAIDKQDLKVSPGVGVANGITTTYASGPSSVHFLNIQTDGMTVVKDRDGETVVFDRVATLP
jgi:hypothetical protein